MTDSYLIVGAGYLGAAVARRLSPARVTVLRRKAEPVAGATLFQADLRDADSLKSLPPCSHVIYAAAADQASDEFYEGVYLHGLQNVLEALQRKGVTPRVSLASSTSVYASQDGSWVDEESRDLAREGLARHIVAGEAYLGAGGWVSTILRFGGIYGPGRDYFLRRVSEGRESLSTGPSRYTNRIHLADAVGMVLHTLGDKRSGIYNGVDCEPADRNEVIRWMAEELGIEPASLPSGFDPDPMPHRGHKRVSNKKILGSGYGYAFPTFREGYQLLISEMISSQR